MSAEAGIAMTSSFEIDRDRIKDFCEKWIILEFSFFGSVLNDNFRADSDLDVMVTFSPDAPWGLFDMVHMKKELEALFERSVDLVTRRAVENSRNSIRRQAILSSAEAVYSTPGDS